MSDNRPIGVLDSGVGGISVLAQLVKLMPNEQYIYFGDSLNAPYGTKSTKEVSALTTATVNKLIEMGCKCIVIACNTATSACAEALRKAYPSTPIIGIEPALKPAALDNPGGRVLVLATAVTLTEVKFAKLLARYEETASIYSLPCPGIVDFVEKGITEGPELAAYLSDIFAPYTSPAPDAVVLGCTHFPFVQKAITSILGNNCRVYNGAEGAARQTLNVLKQRELLTDSKINGTVRFMNSIPSKIELSEHLFELIKEN